jgi:hypothetical protein
MRLIAMIAFMLIAFPALAQDTTVTVEWGFYFGAYVLPIASFIVLVLLIVGLGYAIKLLPPWAQALATPAIQAQLIAYAADALNWGVQAVKDATKDKELTIDVGNAVIAKAAQEFIDTAPKNVIDKLGGIEGVKKWLLQQAEDHHVIIASDTTAAQILNSDAVRKVTGPTNP